jgi:hypothetical protein
MNVCGNKRNDGGQFMNNQLSMYRVFYFTPLLSGYEAVSRRSQLDSASS